MLRAFVARSGDRAVSVATTFLKPNVCFPNTSIHQSFSHSLCFQLKQFGGSSFRHGHARFRSFGGTAPHLQYTFSTKANEKYTEDKPVLSTEQSALKAHAKHAEDKPVLSTEQSVLIALQTKGTNQTTRTAAQVLASSFLGGAYLSWGSMLMFHVGGGSAAVLAPGLLALLKGLVFPIGLSMILLSGSELMTGNFLTQCLPSLKEAPLAQRARILALSGAGNLAGSLAMVAGTVAIGLFPCGSATAAHTVAVATAKCSAPAMTAFLKGVGANWLVGVAIFQAASAQTTPGKIAALWIPICTFISLGLEHSVANMYILPLGMALGADIGVLDITANLVPVALGNAVGAGLMLGGVQRLSLFGPKAFKRMGRS